MLLYFGIAGCVIGYAFLDFGKNVLILVHRKQKVDEEISKCLVLSAVAYILIGSILVFSSLTFLPYVVVAVFGSLQTFYSLLWCRFFNGIDISARQLLGALSICAGCALMYEESTDKIMTPPMNPIQLFRSYSKPYYQSYLIIICVLHFIIGCYNTFRTKYNELSPVTDIVLFSVQTAMLGTQYMVMAKTIAMLLRLYASNDVKFNTTFNGGFLIASILVFIISVLFWKHRVSISESKFDISLIKPLNQMLWVAFAVLSGGIYFEEIGNVGLIHVIYSLTYTMLGIWFAHVDPLLHGTPLTKQESAAFLKDLSSDEETSEELAAKDVIVLCESA